MSKGLIFFCCACAILLFTIINISVGPIISGKVGNDYYMSDPDDSSSYINLAWGTANCEYFSDLYDEVKKTLEGDALKYGPEWGKNECYRKKGMHDMEYTSFIFNAVIGFVCALLGLFHLFDVKKEYVSKTGIIGLVCGIVGFIFSFVYVILNGLVFTTVDTGITKTDSDRKFAEWDASASAYKCIYFEKGNEHAYHATISDFGKKQYNYDKDLYYTNGPCAKSSSPCDEDDGYYNGITSQIPGCANLYSTNSKIDSIANKDVFDRFLTTLLLSLFVCLANIGLAIFGFLLFRTPGEF